MDVGALGSEVDARGAAEHGASHEDLREAWGRVHAPVAEEGLGVGTANARTRGPQVAVGADVAGDDRTALEFLHDPGRQVVEHSPVAEQLTLVGDGWCYPRYGHARAHPHRQRAAVVDDRHS